MTQDVTSLDGQLLIAMPGMGDPRFEKSVVFLCAHSEDGALGLIVNKPSREIRFQNLIEQLDLESAAPQRDIRVHFGGPVENERGFVLHSNDYAAEAATLRVSEQFGMTATLDVLEESAKGAGPASALLALGYAGWGPQQLERELEVGGWLMSAATIGMVFYEGDDLWKQVTSDIGDDIIYSAIDPRHIPQDPSLN